MYFRVKTWDKMWKMYVSLLSYCISVSGFLFLSASAVIEVMLQSFCILSPGSFGSSAHKQKQVPRKLCTTVYYAIHFIWNVPYKMLWSKCLRSRTASLRRVDASLFPSFPFSPGHPFHPSPDVILSATAAEFTHTLPEKTGTSSIETNHDYGFHGSLILGNPFPVMWLGT